MNEWEKKKKYSNNLKTISFWMNIKTTLLYALHFHKKSFAYHKHTKRRVDHHRSRRRRRRRIIKVKTNSEMVCRGISELRWNISSSSIRGIQGTTPSQSGSWMEWIAGITTWWMELWSSAFFLVSQMGVYVCTSAREITNVQTCNN